MASDRQKREAVETATYGVARAAAIDSINELVAPRIGHPLAANQALAAILADCALLLDLGRTEDARHGINRVKLALERAAPIELWRNS